MTEIKCFDIKHIVLGDQRITEFEINLLPCHQIQSVTLIQVVITNSDGHILPVEDLCTLFPNAITKW